MGIDSRPKYRNSKIRKIGLVVRHDQPVADAFALELAEGILARRNLSIFLADESPSAVKALTKVFKGRIKVTQKKKLHNVCDIIVVLGGDGTFLGVARLLLERNVPILGVNMGKLGFLTEIQKSEAKVMLDKILDGQSVRMTERALLEVILRRDGKVVHSGPIVNDAVISKGAIARIIDMEISANGSWIHDVRADGIIVSTPTGSTAYNLAAGGPIIEPSLKSLVMTPICPHSLTQRSLIIPDDFEISIRLKDRFGLVVLTLDGQRSVGMKEDDVVVIRKYAKHKLQLISSPSRDYFTILREKLNFGMRI